MSPKEAAMRNVQEQIARREERQREEALTAAFTEQYEQLILSNKQRKADKIAKREERERQDAIEDAITKQRGRIRLENDGILFGNTDRDTNSAVDAAMEYKRLYPNRPSGIRNVIMNDLMRSKERRDIPDAARVTTYFEDEIPYEQDEPADAEYAIPVMGYNGRVDNGPFYREDPRQPSHFSLHSEAVEANAESKRNNIDELMPSLTLLDNREAKSESKTRDEYK
jgi:hypothetical protein